MSSYPLVECVPNFSEGRRPEVIRKIVHAIRSGGAVHVLDVSSDRDHNRTVVTVVGRPNEMEKAIFDGIQMASTLIDLNEHAGVHPRFGATDVVPFIPLRHITMQECVAIAERVGQRVGNELDLPVYLYEQAASRPERKNLAAIRRINFQYEDLKQTIGNNPDYMPDFGPAKLGPAGAVIIGARNILVAFNVFLDTDNVHIAQAIAQTIRESDGGLAHVKAVGFLVNGRAQVSMNLTDVNQTPIYRAVDAIRDEAQVHGVTIHSSEMVGLAPQSALIDSARWYLQLENFQSDQILDIRIAQSEAHESSLGIEEPPVPTDATRHVQLPEVDEGIRPTAFVEAVAENTPTPGGGAVLALVGALGASLLEMMSGLTLTKKRYENVYPEMHLALSEAHQIRERLLDAILKDIVAYDEVMAAYRLTRIDSGQQYLIEEKMRGAIDVPMQVCQLALNALKIAHQIVAIGVKGAAIDLAVGSTMLMAAIDAAGLNIRVNLLDISQPELKQSILENYTALRDEAQTHLGFIIDIAEKRAGLRE